MLCECSWYRAISNLVDHPLSNDTCPSRNMENSPLPVRALRWYDQSTESWSHNKTKSVEILTYEWTLCVGLGGVRGSAWLCPPISRLIRARKLWEASLEFSVMPHNVDKNLGTSVEPLHSNQIQKIQATRTAKCGDRSFLYMAIVERVAVLKVSGVGHTLHAGLALSVNNFSNKLRACACHLGGLCHEGPPSWQYSFDDVIRLRVQ